MAFMVETSPRRVYDPVRQLELKIHATAPDGLNQFCLTAPEWTYYFIAKCRAERMENVYDDQGKMVNKITWIVSLNEKIDGCSVEETESILREGLSAFKFGYGLPESSPVDVEFKLGRTVK